MQFLNTCTVTRGADSKCTAQVIFLSWLKRIKNYFYEGKLLILIFLLPAKIKVHIVNSVSNRQLDSLSKNNQETCISHLSPLIYIHTNSYLQVLYTFNECSCVVSFDFQICPHIITSVYLNILLCCRTSCCSVMIVTEATTCTV